MFGWVRVLLIGFVVLTIIYLFLSLRARLNYRDRLAREFDQGGVPGDRETYIRDGMRAYQHSLRKKLLLGVYIVPLLALVTLIYVMNFM